jgi:hypothetical protein
MKEYIIFLFLKGKLVNYCILVFLILLSLNVWHFTTVLLFKLCKILSINTSSQTR